MIGLFGQVLFDPASPVEDDGMFGRLPDSLAISQQRFGGAVLGTASHGGRFTSSVTDADDGISVHVSGWIVNTDDFDMPGRPDPSPAEVVHALIARGDIDGLSRINGQFAAAAFDPAKRELTLITDRNGTLPIYVWQDDTGIAFASQLYVLAGLGRIPRKADTRIITELFTMQRTLGRSTPIAGIEALPSATVYTHAGGRSAERTYWQLVWQRGRMSKIACAEQLAAAIREAVVRQAALGDESGLLLSGGIDSRLVLAAAEPGSLSCWTTASYDDNPELALARRIATQHGAEHHACVIGPEDTFDFIDPTVRECGGLYPASTPVSAFLPMVDDSVDLLLTGHGLDYTLRGYYLPSRFLEIGGSKTRLPALRPIPKRPTGHDVLNSLRQGPPRSTIDRITAAGRRDRWGQAIGDKLETILAPWLDSEDPYNAWDAFILNNVSKHYAFTSMMSVRARTDLAMPAFDNDVFDIYLRMPTSWRCEGRVLQLAMQIVSPETARIANANTHFRADLHPWAEIAGLLGRGALRRLGILGREALPSKTHSQGSWQNLSALFREEPRFNRRLKEIRGRLDETCLDIMEPGAVRACIDEHLEGRKSHGKLLRQLLTHDSWMRSFGIEGHA
ncbi:MAG: asparagine synthase-related protein [Rhodospirillales bacterium]